VAPVSRRLSRGVPPDRRGQDALETAGETPALRAWFQGEDKLQFEVNGQEYFLNFMEDERRWFVLVPSETGVNRIPVYVDGSKYERIGAADKGRQNRPN
jgi:hypothetical protein